MPPVPSRLALICPARGRSTHRATETRRRSRRNPDDLLTATRKRLRPAHNRVICSPSGPRGSSPVRTSWSGGVRMARRLTAIPRSELAVARDIPGLGGLLPGIRSQPDQGG